MWLMDIQQIFKMQVSLAYQNIYTGSYIIITPRACARGKVIGRVVVVVVVVVVVSTKIAISRDVGI